jgi:hypothetical protein
MASRDPPSFDFGVASKVDFIILGGLTLLNATGEIDTDEID